MSQTEEYFQFKCEQGFANRGFVGRKNYEDRLAYEISIITSMGFCGYFLIVQDIIKYALDNGIPVGPGRGSVGGSLVAYSLEITHCDPIKYGLIFERFLNPSRAGIPAHEQIIGKLNITTDLTTEQLYTILESGEYIDAGS